MDPSVQINQSNQGHSVGSDDEFVQNFGNATIETPYHQSIYNQDYSLPVACNEEIGYEHETEHSNESGPDIVKELPKNPQLEQKESIQRCIQTMVHASVCIDSQCGQPSCLKMKRVFHHTKACERRSHGDCPVCKQLISLSCFHAKRCADDKCSVLFCLNIKRKLKELQTAERKGAQQAEALRDRVAIITQTAPTHTPQQQAICEPNNATIGFGLMQQMQAHDMNQSCHQMQNNQMGCNVMVNESPMDGINNDCMMAGTTSMMPNTSINPTGVNNQMNAGNMMNTNNQMMGAFGNAIHMGGNAMMIQHPIKTDQCAFASSLTPTNAINSQVNANATFTLNQHGSVEYPFVQQQQQQVTTVTWSNHGQGNQSHVNVVSNHNQLMPNIERTGAFCFGAQELPQYVREGLNEELKMESSFGKSRQMMNRKSSRTQFTVKRVERLQENVVGQQMQNQQQAIMQRQTWLNNQMLIRQQQHNPQRGLLRAVPPNQPGIMGGMCAGEQAMVENIDQQKPKEALQEIMVALGNQNQTSDQRNEQIINILKSSPQLRSAFVKQRQSHLGPKGTFETLPIISTGSQYQSSAVVETQAHLDSITPELRNHVRNMLVEALFSSPDPAVHAPQALQAYANKMEGDMYAMANSRLEYYYRLVAKKVYEIQKDKQPTWADCQMQQGDTTVKQQTAQRLKTKTSSGPVYLMYGVRKSFSKRCKGSGIRCVKSREKCIQSLEHAYGCVDQQCRQPSCLKMKWILGHTKKCKRDMAKKCPVCKRFFLLCGHHARLCSKPECSVCRQSE